LRLGIITDVHSNTEALTAVLAELKRENVDTIVHLGDAVGYGAEPNECCDLLRGAVQLSLMGNHDAAVAGVMDTAWFASHAKAAVDWTIGALRQDHLEWLTRQPYTYREGEFLFSHGSPVGAQEFRYVLSQFDADEILAWVPRYAKGVRVVFVGHAHQCVVFSDIEGYQIVDGIQRSEFDLSSGRWVVNVGSVGQPRDGDPRACFAILDTESGRYEARRVAYEVAATQAKIRAAALPEVLSARLALGR
jgi:diadenosine tetraphosphatase ApaH/serine/threonine PP2A family protein phosphatase